MFSPCVQMVPVRVLHSSLAPIVWLFPPSVQTILVLNDVPHCVKWSPCVVMSPLCSNGPRFRKIPACGNASPCVWWCPPFVQNGPSVWSCSPSLCGWYVHPCVLIITVWVRVPLCPNDPSVWSSICCVSRWRKLPRGTDRNWAHVVDARFGYSLSF